MSLCLFADGMPRPGDPFYQHPLGYYCDMYGPGGPEGPPPDIGVPPQPHPGFLMQPEETITPLEAHPPGS